MGGTDGAEGATNLELNPDLWVVSAAGGRSDLPKRRLLDLLLVRGGSLSAPLACGPLLLELMRRGLQ